MLTTSSLFVHCHQFKRLLFIYSDCDGKDVTELYILKYGSRVSVLCMCGVLEVRKAYLTLSCCHSNEEIVTSRMFYYLVGGFCMSG